VISDPRVFSRLFEQHAGPLTGLVARMVKSRHVAAELVQDVFLRLWSNRSALEIRDDLHGYLRRAARNRALDWLRREELHRQWERLATLESQSTPYESHAADPDRLSQMQEALAMTLDAMPPRRRAVCELRWRDGLRPGAIAQRLDVSLKTVETHVTRGLKDVRATLQLRRS
jgi:RNA polymerase sigma-70 factor (family 1)